jgi:hypothetical protein
MQAKNERYLRERITGKVEEEVVHNIEKMIP